MNFIDDNINSDDAKWTVMNSRQSWAIINAISRDVTLIVRE